MRRSLPPIAAALFATTVASVASAHINLTVPAPRHADPIEDQKAGPCGIADSPRSATPTELVAGEFIEIVWNETIEHESYFRLAFLEEGDAFPNPEDFEIFCDPAIDPWCVADGLEDGVIEGEFSFVWPVPETPCDNCTLQLIQVMVDGDGLQLDDLYFDCADVIIVEPGGSTTSASSTTATGSGGGSSGDGGGGPTGGGDGDGDGDGDATAAGAGGATATSSSTAGATPEAKVFAPEEGCQVSSSDAAIGLAAPLALAFGALAARRRRRD